MMTKITVPSGIGIWVRIDGKEDSPWLVLSSTVAVCSRACPLSIRVQATLVPVHER